MTTDTAAKGFTLIEMLVAAAITLTITGAVFHLIDPAQGAFRAQPEAADLQQRLRTAVETLAGNLRMAGAGASAGLAAGPLVDFAAPVLPYRVGDIDSDVAAGVFFREDAVSLLFVPSATADTALRAAGAGANPLAVSAQGDCLANRRRALCGFTAGMRILLVDPSGVWEALRLTDVDDDALELRHDGVLSSPYVPGSTVAQVVRHTYYLAADDDAGTYRLMHYDGAGTDLPLVDDIVMLEFEYFGDPQPPLRPDPPAIGAVGTLGWPPGENCVFAVEDGRHVPRLPPLGGPGLVRLTADSLTDGPWCPNDVAPARFDADLLRLRRVRVRLRAQVAAESLRGRSSLFLRPGTSPGGERLVPDQEIRFDIAPRNLTPDR
jgi:prepilin-type N-terminal cleavage/methylation domain-containing protein